MTRRSRGLLWIVAAIQIFASSTLAHRAIFKFTHPPPISMTGIDRWYLTAMQAALAAIVAGCCMVAACRNAAPRGWEERKELRVALYCVATGLLFALPVGIVKVIQARAQRGPPQTSFADAFPTDAVLYPAIGMAMILYDRRRLQRDSAADGCCHHCGYDLTANVSGVCPECGTPTDRPT